MPIQYGDSDNEMHVLVVNGAAGFVNVILVTIVIRIDRRAVP